MVMLISFIVVTHYGLHHLLLSADSGRERQTKFIAITWLLATAFQPFWPSVWLYGSLAV
jgi:hypothetical protein